MGNFYTAPLGIDQEDVIRERFRLGSKRLDGAAVLEIMQRINEATYDPDNNGTVWMTPDADHDSARVHGVPLEIGGRAVRYVSRQEFAVFPVRAEV